MKVAVLGASSNPERYSNRAVRLLLENGHEVVPVNPGQSLIEGLPVVPELRAIKPGDIDTITMYVGPRNSDGLLDDLLAVKPRRVIFNPGSENPPLAAALEKAGIETARIARWCCSGPDCFDIWICRLVAALVRAWRRARGLISTD